MLLRGVPLRKPLRSRMFNTPRALKGFLILAPHPKSLRQIGNLWFSERTPEVLTNLSWEVRFFEGNGEGIEALAKPIFVRGASPFYGSGTAALFNGSGTAARPRPASKMDSLAWLRCGGRGRACRRGGQAPWRLAKPMRLPPKFPHMEFCIYPNKMPTRFILPENFIL